MGILRSWVSPPAVDHDRRQASHADVSAASRQTSSSVQARTSACDRAQAPVGDLGRLARHRMRGIQWPTDWK